MSLKTLEKPSGVGTCMPVFSSRFTNTTYFLPVITHPSIFFPANPLSTIVPLPPLAVDSAATAARCLSIVPLPPLAVDWLVASSGKPAFLKKGGFQNVTIFGSWTRKRGRISRDFKVLQVLIHGRVFISLANAAAPCLFLLPVVADAAPAETNWRSISTRKEAASTAATH
jgi:hypothetical protein